MRMRQPRGFVSTYYLKHYGVSDLVIEIISVSAWDKRCWPWSAYAIPGQENLLLRHCVTEYRIYDPEGKKDKICLFEGF